MIMLEIWQTQSSLCSLFMLIYLPLWCWALQPDVPAVESTSVGRWQRRRTSRLHHGSGSRRSTPTLSPLRTSRRSPLQMFFRHKMHAKVGWDGWGLWLIEKGIFIPLPLRSLSPTCPLPQPSSLSSSWLVWKERRTYKGGTHWRHLSIWAALYLGGALADSRKDARWLDRPRTCKSTLD